MAVPPTPTPLGNSDTVSVASGSYKNLTVKQLLDGTTNTITIGPGILISPINPTTSEGVTTSQGNGDGDVTTITGVATPTPAPVSIYRYPQALACPTSPSFRAAGPVIPPA